MSDGKKLVMPPALRALVEKSAPVDYPDESQYVDARPVEREPEELHAPPDRAPDEVRSVFRGGELTRKINYVPDTHRLLPQSPDAEKSLLSSFLLSPIQVGGMCREQGITRAHFFMPHYAEIYAELLDLWERGESIDFITLTQILRDKGRLDACGGAAEVTELFTFLPTAANAAYYVEILQEKYVLRQTIIHFTAITARCYEQQNEVPGILLDLEARTAEICDTPLGIERGVETHSLLDLLNHDVTNNPDTIIGRHWLMRGGSALWIGPSGIGKSSLALQMAVHFAMGLPFCGITPGRPLKSVFMQAENDLGDLAEMAQGVMHHLQTTMPGIVTAEMMELCKKNLVFVRDMIHVGAEFAAAVRQLLRKHKPDLLWADPLLSYVGDDISKQAVASQFLRNWLNPILVETGVCMMFMHHTGKPPTDPASKSHWKDSDMAYASFGSSELVNWARSVNVLRPLGEGVFELHLAKRGKRAGARDLDGQFTDKIYLAHAVEGIAWRQVAKPEENEEGEQGGAGRFKPKYEDAPDVIVGFMAERSAPWTAYDLVQAIKERTGYGKSTAYKLVGGLMRAKRITELPDRSFIITPGGVAE